MRLAAVILAASLLASGCGSSGNAEVDPSTSPATPLDLPLDGWTGGAGDTAAMAGVLHVDDDGCVYLGDDPAVHPLVAWPAGFSASLDDQGRVTLFHDGQAVAHQGDYLTLGGGDLTNDTIRSDCLPPQADYFAVQSDVVVGPAPSPTTPHDLATPGPTLHESWRLVHADELFFEVPADWTVDEHALCTGVAMAAPSRVRTSCPPQPSVTVFEKSTFSPEATPAGSEARVVGDKVVLVVGASEATSRKILHSVRHR